jgi:hypothetical protein
VWLLLLNRALLASDTTCAFAQLEANLNVLNVSDSNRQLF